MLINNFFRAMNEESERKTVSVARPKHPLVRMMRKHRLGLFPLNSPDTLTDMRLANVSNQGGLVKDVSKSFNVHKILEESGGKTILDFNPFSTIDFRFESFSLKDKTTFIWKQFLDFVQNNRSNQRIEKLVKTELIK